MVELSELSQNPHLRFQAARMAEASIKRLSGTDGILHDGCEPSCGEDASQFKGVYVRNLGYLFHSQPEAMIGAFLQLNADSLWGQRRDLSGDFSVGWSERPGFKGAEGDISALDLFVAATQAISRDREDSTSMQREGTK